MAQAAQQLRRTGGGGGFGGGGGGGGAEMAAPMEAMDMTDSVRSVASATELGEYFEYTVGSVTIPRQSSAMLPIIADAVEAERVSLYDPEQLRGHPLNAAILTNSTGKPLLAGPVTVFEAGGYAGDARVGDLPAGGERLVTFGVDLKIEARVEPRPTRAELVTAGLSQGVLTLKRRLRTQYQYVFENAAGDERTLVLEHPYDRGYDLVDTPEPYETTESARRFKFDLPPGAGTFTVTAETVTDQAVALLDRDYDADQLVSLSRGGAIPEGVREALAKAAELRRAVADAEAGLARVTGEIGSIAQEQERIRKNMDSVDRQSDYYRRLLEKLDAQETRLEELDAEREELEQTLQQRRAAYRDFLENANV